MSKMVMIKEDILEFYYIKPSATNEIKLYEHEFLEQRNLIEIKNKKKKKKKRKQRRENNENKEGKNTKRKTKKKVRKQRKEKTKMF